MRKRLLTVALCLAMGSMTALWAQAVQNVVVKEYQAKNQKTPLADVGVTVGNAGAAMTDGDGRAMLRFRSLKAGDRVTLRRVEKDGYEVFNRDAVEQWTVSPSAEFQLVLCRSDKFRQLRDQYQRVASQSYDRQYRAEQQRLANERKEGKLQEEAYQQRLLDLQDQYEQQLEDLENYVDKFARIDLSELSAQEQELIELVQEGRIEEAISLYEQHDYLGQYERETRDIAEIDRAQQQLAQLEEQKRSQREAVMASINRQVGTYRLAGGRENFEKIGKLLKGVADADTTNVEALMLYAEFAAQQNDFEETDRYASLMLRNAGEDYVRLAEACTSLYVSSSVRFETERALAYLDQAIGLLSTHREESITIYDRWTYCLYLRYNYLTVLEHYDEAEAMFAEVSQAFETVIARQEETNVELLLRQAQLMSKHGLAMCEAGRVEEAERLWQESLQRIAPLIDEKDVFQVSSYCTVLSDYMMVLEAQERWSEQIPLLKEGVRIYTTLYKQNPEATAPVIFEWYANLSDALVQNDMLDDADTYIASALEVLTRVREKFSAEAFAVNETGFYDTVAMYYQKRGDEPQMREYARRCLAAYSLLVDEMKEMLAPVAERWQSLEP